MRNYRKTVLSILIAVALVVMLALTLVLLLAGSANAAANVDTADTFEPKPMCSVPEPDNFRPNLRQGNYGLNVEYLQSLLDIHADGCFGPVTHHAVVEFQQSHNLLADGIVGASCTWPALHGEAIPSSCLVNQTVQLPAAGANEPNIVISFARQEVQLRVGTEVIDRLPMIGNNSVHTDGVYEICQFIPLNTDSHNTWYLHNFVRMCKVVDGEPVWTGRGFHAIPVGITSGRPMHDESFLGTGQKTSSGCTRLSVEDSEILWDFATLGMTVTVS